MSDNDIQSRNDMLAPPPPSLPPTQKLAKGIWEDVFLLALVGLGLLSAKWSLLTGDQFDKFIFSVLVVKATLATGKGVSVDAIQSFFKR